MSSQAYMYCPVCKKRGGDPSVIPFDWLSIAIVKSELRYIWVVCSDRCAAKLLLTGKYQIQDPHFYRDRETGNVSDPRPKHPRRIK